MKKIYRKILCLFLLFSMLVSMSGCAMLMQNVRQEMKQQDAMEDKESGQPAAEVNDAKNQADKSALEKAKENKQPSAAQEELMSDYFTAKMELLAQLVDQYYMYDISVEDMRTGAYKGLLEGLGDPYTCYYTAEEFDALMETTSGTYYGIGAVVQQNLKTMYITIVKPYVDGPAYNAGMLPGDIIYMVDGVDVTGMEIDNVVAMMKGPEGTIVKVTVIRDGVADPIELTITRGKIEIETIEYEMLENNIGYIAISGFDEPTPKQFKDAIKALQKQNMKGLIIDLRDNGGGLGCRG